MGLDFILFLGALLLISIAAVLVRHGRRIYYKNRYTDPRNDIVYHDLKGREIKSDHKEQGKNFEL